jgi:hypothetical protein
MILLLLSLYLSVRWDYGCTLHALPFYEYKFFFSIVLLFICAYNAWVISPPCPLPLPYDLSTLSLSPTSPQYLAETILPLSLILL